jgi:type I restriction enzyme S subunit
MELGHICEMIVDCEHKTAPTQETGNPSIRTPNIGRGHFILDNVNRVSDETYKLWTRRAVPKAGDLIMAREAPVGNVAMIPKGLQPCLGQRTLLIRCDKSKVDPRYLVYLLIGPDVQATIQGMTNGVTVPHLNMEDIRTLPLPDLPPLCTQRKIAAILSAYDDLIENNTRRIKILKEMAQAIYREWFVHFRFPGHEGVKMVETELGLVPEGWEVIDLHDTVAYINRGVSPKYDKLSGQIVINQKCIRDNKLNLEQARRHSTHYGKEKAVKFGDVLINSTGIGTLGRVAQVYQDLEDCTVDSHITIARPNDYVQVDYFGMYLISLQSYFDRMGTGATGQTELSRQAISDARFLLPPMPIQTDYGLIVSPMRKASINFQERNAVLSRTRDLLLPKLVSGELDVSEMEVAVNE